jgi:crossover junction endodeoxyribonuclease RuvC
MVTALGVDPGFRATGYSLVRGDSGGCALIEVGVLGPSQGDPFVALREIYEDITSIFRQFPPDVLVVEEVFAHRAFPQVSLSIAQVRAVICLAAAVRGVAVEELPSATVKQALTGSGRASKHQVQAMVARLLGVPSFPNVHAADATALALTALSRRGVPIMVRGETPVAPGR